MTGAALRFGITDARSLDGFRRLERLGRSQALLAQIGETIVQSTRERFHRGVDPEGRPWRPLNAAYAMTKRGPGLLREAGMRGGLMGSIHYRARAISVTVGTNKVYAAVHQFGAIIRPTNAERLVFPLGGRMVAAKSVTIPARPYLGISEDDRIEIGQVVEDMARVLLR